MKFNDVCSERTHKLSRDTSMCIANSKTIVNNKVFHKVWQTMEICQRRDLVSFAHARETRK